MSVGSAGLRLRRVPRTDYAATFEPIRENSPFFRIHSAGPRRPTPGFDATPRDAATCRAHQRPLTARSDAHCGERTVRPPTAGSGRSTRPTTARSDASLARLCAMPLAPRRQLRAPPAETPKGRWEVHGLPPPGTPRRPPPAPRPRSLLAADDTDAGTERVVSQLELTNFESRGEVCGEDGLSTSTGALVALKSVANGMKDYHLTRTLFHLAKLENLPALRAVRNMGEHAFVARVEEYAEQFGTQRLDRPGFHAWLGDVLCIPLTRVDSDLLFDAFDDNRSGTVDEAELVGGVKNMLFARERALVLFLRKLLSDVRATVGTIMSDVEAQDLLNALVSVTQRRFPGIREVVSKVRSDFAPFMQQCQVPTAEFCRALQTAPLIAHVFAVMYDDASLPDSPPPPPTPDPDDDVAAMPRVLRQAERDAAALAHSSTAKSEASLTMEASQSGLVGNVKVPRRPAPRKVVKSRRGLDTLHPAFVADSHLASERSAKNDAPEHDNPRWFIRNGTVWCATDSLGEVVVE